MTDLIFLRICNLPLYHLLSYVVFSQHINLYCQYSTVRENTLYDYTTFGLFFVLRYQA